MEETQKRLEPKVWIELYADQLFKYAMSRIPDCETAKDLVQETFLSALKNIETFRHEISEKNWLYSILKNKIIDYYRRRAKQSFDELEKLTERAEDYFNEKGHWRKTARPKTWSIVYSQANESKEFYEILGQCKDRLATLQCAVFTLKYLEEKKSDEICKGLNISSSNYWVLIHRAKLQIRQCLERNWFIK